MTDKQLTDGVARRRLAALDRALVRAYGEPRRRRRRDPLGSLIATILSQNTNDTNSGRAYDAMRAAYPTWEKVLAADPGELEEVLRPGGLAKTKGRRIQKILRAIATQGPLDLGYLRKLPDEDAEDALLAFDGVGLKTARCVLVFALGRDSFPIDTHIERVLKRLGIVPGKMAVDKAHRHIQPLLPKGRSYALHVGLITHGRRVCHARNPECEPCALRRGCEYAKRRRARAAPGQAET